MERAMSEFKTAAYACFVACEDKTRKFLYNDSGVFEAVYSGYEKIDWSKFKQIAGSPIEIDQSKINKFLNSLKWGHDVFGKDKTHPTRDTPMFSEPLGETPINRDVT